MKNYLFFLFLSALCGCVKLQSKDEEVKTFVISFMEGLYGGRADSILSNCLQDGLYKRLIAEHKVVYEELSFKNIGENTFFIQKYEKNTFEEKYLFDILIKGKSMEKTMKNIIVLKENNKWKLALTIEEIHQLLENEYHILYSLARITCSEKLFEDLLALGYGEDSFTFSMEFANCLLNSRKFQKACDFIIKAHSQNGTNLNEKYYTLLANCDNINADYSKKYNNIIHEDAVSGIKPAIEKKVNILWNEFISDFKRSTLDSCYFWANIGKDKGIKSMDSVLEDIEKFRKKKLKGDK